MLTSKEYFSPTLKARRRGLRISTLHFGVHRANAPTWFPVGSTVEIERGEPNGVYNNLSRKGVAREL